MRWEPTTAPFRRSNSRPFISAVRLRLAKLFFVNINIVWFAFGHFVSSFRRAYELAFAMECRCYTGGEGRTRMKQMKLKGLDSVLIVGCAVLLSIWAAVVAAAFLSAARSLDAERQGSAVLSCGLAAAICVQMCLNVAGVLNALPMTGIPLPLISHGGTSLVATLAMCGILAGLAGTGKPEEELVVPEKKKRSIRNNGNGNRRRDAVRRGTRNSVGA